MKNVMYAFLMIPLALMISMPVSGAMTHRYDFTADANDVVGGLETTLENGTVVSGGALVLPGGSPGGRAVLDANSIGINSYTQGATIEVWFSVDTLGGWTRVFDFGDTSGNDGGYYLFYTPSGPGNSRMVISTGGFPGWQTGEQYVNGPALTAGQKYHVVCVYDAGGGSGGNSALRIYQDGVQVGANENVTMPLSGVHTAYAYLGSASYPNDPELDGSIDEFRIYDSVLSPVAVLLNNQLGPDTFQACALTAMSPANDSTGIAIPTALSWTPDTSVAVDHYEVYVNADPNVLDPNSVVVPAVPTDYSGSNTTYTNSGLDYQTTYFWRVDTVASDTTRYVGPMVQFTTLPPYPVFTADPSSVYVFEGQTAVMTATCQSDSPWSGNVQWFKVGTPDSEVVSGGDVTIVTQDIDSSTKTSTLTITNVTDPSDAGSYYAKVANLSGPAESARASLVIKKLLASYQFEGNPNDSSGNGLDGTILTPSGAAATATYVPSMTGAMGQAILFTGTGISNPSNTTDPYVDLPDGFSDFSAGLTISAWVNPSSTAAWQRIFQFGNGTNGANNSFYLTRNASTTQVRFENDNTSPTSATRVTAGNDTFVDNVWQMLTITLSTDATNNAVIYRNGVAVATGTITLPNVVTRTNCYLGRSEWYGDYLFRGLMDDVRIYNYPLSAVDVAQQYVDANPDADYVCLPDPGNPLIYDINGDCQVNLADLTALAQNWLGCERVPASSCGW